ncbi:MAG: hypothetical protein A2X86_13835 [Bdellovibrionales bacterium GWA2_49_15]|nr:MAG: hypothetical protein A2X86_13835 [Bdellovibrionales bacterium GWA2_49_15]HAZ13608.1 hypothetical protein [Bdellovibrionales bacterium]
MKFSELTPWRSPRSSALSSVWPFSRGFDADTFESNIDDFMRDFETDFDSSQWLDYGTRAFPSIDVKETPESYSVDAELPGLTAKDVEIEVANNSLYIKGEIKEDPTKEKGYICSERCHGPFSRKISFGDEINMNNIDAQLKDGVLHIELKKQNIEVPKHKSIEIRQ